MNCFRPKYPVAQLSMNTTAVLSEHFPEMKTARAQAAVLLLKLLTFFLSQLTVKTDITAKTVVKGDALSESIAAASILAKVSRDRVLVQMDADYPQYGFAVHKGYGTAAHTAALRKYGPCPEHRPSFLKKILGDR